MEAQEQQEGLDRWLTWEEPLPAVSAPLVQWAFCDRGLGWVATVWKTWSSSQPAAVGMAQKFTAIGLGPIWAINTQHSGCANR